MEYKRHGTLSLTPSFNIVIQYEHIKQTVYLATSPESILSLIVLGVLVYVLRYSWRQILFGTSYRLGNLLREQFYQKLTLQGQAFFSQHNTGDLMARATNDIDAIEMAAGEGILSGFDGVLTFTLVLLMMFLLIDWQLTLVALIPFPFMGLAFYRISNAVHFHFQDSLEKFSRLNESTQQALVGIRLVKAMGRETVESRGFSAIAEDAAKSNYKVARSEALFDPAIFVSLTLAVLFTLSFGGYRIHQGSLTIGELTSFTMYMGQLIWPMWAFGWLLNIVERGSAAHKRVQYLLDLPASVEDSGTEPLNGADLSVHRLDFSYPDSKVKSLHQVSFNLKQNKVLGLAGPTGSGKSTLVQLLMRYWQVPEASILLADKPIHQYQLKALRSAYAYVPQDAFLFSASIAANIALSRPDASQQDIEQAAKVAAIHQDIQGFPDGYKTMVGERGVTLSGGQRQRIAIARALISNAAILVLDDALSAVDVHTERAILDHLKTRRKRQSAIIISHRLSALEHADEILILCHGEVVERGDHCALLRQEAWYARMHTYQQMEADLNER